MEHYIDLASTSGKCLVFNESYYLKREGKILFISRDNQYTLLNVSPLLYYTFHLAQTLSYLTTYIDYIRPSVYK